MPETCSLSIADILALDAEYRELAEAGALPKIAPKRENPSGLAWLPVLNRRLANGRVSLLFSNTPLAHRLVKTGDWVVLYYHESGKPRGSQCTVVTEWHPGPLQGKRVVRGREEEALAYYRERGLDAA